MTSNLLFAVSALILAFVLNFNDTKRQYVWILINISLQTIGFFMLTMTLLQIADLQLKYQKTEENLSEGIIQEETYY